MEGLDSFKLTGIELTERELGTGSYASVFEVKYLGLKCAGKKIHELLLRQGGGVTYAVRRFDEECRLLSQLRHPNIVQFLGVYTERGMQAPILVMEFLPTNLTSCVETHLAPCVDGRHTNIHPEISYSILHDVALGLNYLHNQVPPIVHRDLSSNNVLLTSNMKAKISDLGVAKMLDLSPLQVSRVAFNTHTPGTPAYMPPEAMISNPMYDVSIDVFSFGVMIIHVFSGKWPEPQGGQIRIERGKMIPVSEAERREVYLRVVGNKHPLMNLILRCIDNDFQARPKIRNVISRLSSLVEQKHFPLSNPLGMLQRIKSQQNRIEELQQQINKLKLEATASKKSGSCRMPPRSVRVSTQLPRCEADGCQNQVWYDPGLGQAVFSYCSPDCRNRHLLPIEKQKLRKDLRNLKKELERVVTSKHGTTVQAHRQHSPVLSGTNMTKFSKPISGPIRFYNKGEPFYEFTNFFPAPIYLDGKVWPTTEHYFQAQKFIGTPFAEVIRNFEASRQAFDLSRNPTVSRWQRRDWNEIKLDVMRKTLLTKFTQHEKLQQKLLGTGEEMLIQHSPHDKFWGNGGDDSGENHLGMLLMELRFELQNIYKGSGAVIIEQPSSFGGGKENSLSSSSSSSMDSSLPQRRVTAYSGDERGDTSPCGSPHHSLMRSGSGEDSNSYGTPSSSPTLPSQSPGASVPPPPGFPALIGSGQSSDPPVEDLINLNDVKVEETEMDKLMDDNSGARLMPAPLQPTTASAIHNNDTVGCQTVRPCQRPENELNSPNQNQPITSPVADDSVDANASDISSIHHTDDCVDSGITVVNSNEVPASLSGDNADRSDTIQVDSSLLTAENSQHTQTLPFSSDTSEIIIGGHTAVQDTQEDMDTTRSNGSSSQQAPSIVDMEASSMTATVESPLMAEDRGANLPAVLLHPQAIASQHDFDLHHMPSQRVLMRLPWCELENQTVCYDPGLRQGLFSQSPTLSTVESGSSSSPSSTKSGRGDKVKPKRKSVVVVIEKQAGKPCGLILSKEPFVTDQNNIQIGFVVVGVVKESKVYKKVQDDLIRMFDVIETVNDKPCADLIVPETDIQESFEKFIKSKDSVKLHLNRSVTFPLVSRLLSDARKRYLVYSHILGLRYSKGSSDDYGLTLSNAPGQGEYVRVIGISKGSPADLCRLKFRDKVCMYALASPEGIQSSQSVSSKTLVQVKMDLEKAHRAKMNVILVVLREMLLC